MTTTPRVRVLSFIAVLSTLAALSSASLPAAAQGEETVISEDTSWTGESRTLSGGLRVENGTTLTILGGDIRFGGPVVVEPGAVLELGAFEGAPAWLRPASDASTFWLDVQGTTRSTGPAAAQIEGVWGQGLASVVHGSGGVQVSGVAELSGLVLRDSGAGIVVREGGRLALHDATLDATGEIGVGVMGSAELGNASILGNTFIGLTGRETCDIRAADIVVESNSQNVLVNSCDVSLDRSSLRGSGVAITGTGSARVDVNDTTVVGYRIDGASASPLPDRPAPRVYFRNVTFDGGPEARRGAELTNVAEAVFDRVTITGHQSHGLYFIQTNSEIRDCSIQGNGGYGVFGLGGDVAVDVATCDFGLGASGAPNARGGVYHLGVVEAYARDLELGTMAGLNITLRSSEASGSRIVFAGQTNGTAPVASMAFETYATHGDGSIEFLGPFVYRAEHAAFDDGPRTGTLDLGNDLVFIVGHEHPEETTGADWFTIGMVVVGVGLLFVGATWTLLAVGWRKTRRSIWRRNNGST